MVLKAEQRGTNVNIQGGSRAPGEVLNWSQISSSRLSWQVNNMAPIPMFEVARTYLLVRF